LADIFENNEEDENDSIIEVNGMQSQTAQRQAESLIQI
jgi:hypothetical protein